jgi:putative ATPase
VTARRPDDDGKRVPLADRIRPATLDQVVGQAHLLGPDMPLRRTIEADRLTSLILWGPPGTGKTTLARLLAGHTRAHFDGFSAVLGSVKDVRRVVADAETRATWSKQDTLLFVDEIHRFNKAQQDAFLPHVESGLLTLVGATTENPSFQVIPALLSRCAVMVLHPLAPTELVVLLRRALADDERGLGDTGLRLADDALDRIALHAGGDARKALGALERVAMAQHDRAPDAPPMTVDEVADNLGQDTLRYDRSGEEHYNVISAFIKSVRGSDVHAALYWLARMIEAGEDPMFVARRLVVLASEDVGNADPRALQLAMAAKDAVHFLGLPEGKYPLAQTTIYLATAPKSNSAGGFFRAAAVARKRGALPVPIHLRNAPTALMKELGYGDDYETPHDFDGSHVSQQYLPDELVGQQFFEPGDQGFEKMIRDRMAIWASRSERGVHTLRPGKRGKKH